MCFVPSKMNGFSPVTVAETAGGGATSALSVNFATRLSPILYAGRRRSVVIRKKQKFLVFASKQEQELNDREDVEVKFGKVIGENPRVTLPKIKARRLDPNASVLDVQKSFYKNKANLPDIKVIPLDWAKPCREIRPVQRKAVSSVDGLSLVKPVIKKGVKFESRNKPNASGTRKRRRKLVFEKRELSADDIELEKNIYQIIDKCGPMLWVKPEPESVDKEKELSGGANDLVTNYIESKMVKEEAKVNQIKKAVAAKTQPRLEWKKWLYRHPEVQVNDDVEKSGSRGTSEWSGMKNATKDELDRLASALGNFLTKKAKKDGDKFESSNNPNASESRKSRLSVQKPADEKTELSRDAKTEVVEDIELEKNIDQIIDKCDMMLLRKPESSGVDEYGYKNQELSGGAKAKVVDDVKVKMTGNRNILKSDQMVVRKPKSIDKKEYSGGAKDLVTNHIKLKMVKEEAEVKQSNFTLLTTPETVQTQPKLQKKKLQHGIPVVQVNDDVEQSGSRGTSESSEMNSAAEGEIERLVSDLGNLLTKQAKKGSDKFESSIKPNASKSRKSSLTVQKSVDEKRELSGDAKTEVMDDIELEKNLFQIIDTCGRMLLRKPEPESIEKKKELSSGAEDLVTNNIASEIVKEEAPVKRSNFTLLKTPEAVQTQPRLERRNLQDRIPEVQVNGDVEQSGTRGTSESSEMKSAMKDETERLLNGLGNLLIKEAVQTQSEICNDLVKKKNLMAHLRIGDIVKCRITNITDFGILVEVEGLPALIHHTEVSWDVTWDPSYFKIGQILEAKVNRLSFKLSQISLSLRELLPVPLIDTWESVIGDDNSFDGRLQADIEIIVRASLDKEEMKSSILRCTKRVG